MEWLLAEVCEFGLAKPDTAIFRHLLNHFALPADDCMFIDDAPANVAAARALGIAAHLFRSGDALVAELRQRGLRRAMGLSGLHAAQPHCVAAHLFRDADELAAELR